MSLQDLLDSGRLKTHQATASEISRLLAAADRDLKDAQVAGLSADRSLATAYSAALLAATAALAARGYRVASEGHHYWTIQSLAFTLQLDSRTVTRLDNFRRKRNISDYEMSGTVTQKEAIEMLALARSLHRNVEAWLKKDHPELMRKS